jgi:hypothetical protein
MTILPPQAERDSIGIDTYERAILYAASMLRRSFLVDGEKANLKRLSITTAQSKENNNILIEGEFPYSNSTTWEKGGDVFKPVWYLSLSDPSNSFSPPSNLLPFGNPYIALPSDPTWVATLEEYFIWVLSQSKAALHLESPPRHDVISYRFFDSRSPNPVVEVKVSLPFDLDIWLRDRHFFNALLPLLKYSPAIRAIGIGEFTRQALIESTDTKVRIIGNPLFPFQFTRESTFEISSKYFKIFRNPVVEFTREGVFSSEGARFIPDFSEFVREATITVTQNYVGFAEYTRTTVIDVTLDKKNPIIEQSDFTRETIINVSSNTEGSAVLDTYNSIVPFTIPATSVSEDHFNFVVYIRFSDLNLGITPTEWDNKSDSQKQAFLQSIRVKPPVGNALPTFIRANYDVNDVANPPTIRARGYLYFLAPFLSSQQDNLFFINFNSFSVTDNPDAKQVFQDYWWVSLSGFTQGIYADNIWNENQAPSGLSNNVNAGEGWVISSGLDENLTTMAVNENTLPYPRIIHYESDATDDSTQNSGIQTGTINFNDNPTLSLWTTQGIDSLVKISNLGFDARTQIQNVEEIDKVNNQFKITFWEQFFDDQEKVLVGYFSSGNGDGAVENLASNNTSFIGDKMLSNLEGYGSFTNNQAETISILKKFVINKVDQNWFTLVRVYDFSTFDIGTVNNAPYDGSLKIAGNIDLQSSNSEMSATSFVNFSSLFIDSVRRYDRTINDAYLNGNGQGSDTLTSVLNGALNARLYNGAGVSYIKLAKYTKSQQRIIDEYNNETNPTNFYQIGTAKEVSEFTREAIYEVTELLPIRLRFDYYWSFDATDGSELTDSSNTITLFAPFGYTAGEPPLANDNGNSIDVVSDINETSPQNETTLPNDIKTAIGNESFTWFMWFEPDYENNRIEMLSTSGRFNWVLFIAVTSDLSQFDVRSQDRLDIHFQLFAPKNDSFIGVVVDNNGVKIYSADTSGNLVLQDSTTLQPLSYNTDFDYKLKINQKIDNFGFVLRPLTLAELQEAYDS